ncbi:MAG TPA: beta-N-acetylhexosaminidase [Geminicoccaceae bacterium]|nr:beta-N-acetylhexosaminidase [Geminicoccaceae bacterium]
MSPPEAAAVCRAAVVGIAGLRLTAGERRLLGARPPWGFILFKRNCGSPAQVAQLIAELREAARRPDAPVLIDQEGGRVQRLEPPYWPARPAARRIGAIAEQDFAAGREAAFLLARLIAHDLRALGITINCAPVLDLGLPEQTSAIGDRAFSADPEIVAALGESVVEGYLAGGILPVIKHLPGHGRARVDSHVALPLVESARSELAASDFAPFRACAGAPLAITAHVRYTALDRERPATLSPRIIEEIVRGEIGFAGALLSDDLSMGALGGALGERAARAREAGCDIAVHCNGRPDEMAEVLEAAGALEGEGAARARRALARRTPPAAFDPAATEARLAEIFCGFAPRDHVERIA